MNNNRTQQYASRGNVRPQPRGALISDVRRVVSAQAITKPVKKTHVSSLSAKQKATLLEKALKNARLRQRRQRQQHFKRFMARRAATFIVSGLFLASSGYIALDVVLTNHRVSAQSDTPVAVAHGAAVTPTDPSQEGSDTSPLPANTLLNYQVAPDLPRALYIDKIHVASRLIPMSLNKDSSVQAPVNIYDSGWYTGSVKPGDIGAMLIDGHSSGSTHEGLFGNLDQLVVGDTLQVEKGDGTRLTYQVVFTQVVGLNDVDMHQMLLPYGNALRGLNLMTCTGQWTGTGSNHTLDHRIEVFTQQID